MSTVLIVGETRRGELREVSLELVGAALSFMVDGDRLVAAVADQSASEQARALAVEGVDEVVAVATPTEHFEPHVQEEAVRALIGDVGPDVVLCAFSVDAMGWAPALAAKLGLGFASGVTKLSARDGVLTARRGLYGGKLEAELDFPGKTCVLAMLRPGTFEAAAGAGSAAVRVLDLPFAEPRTEHLGFRDTDAGEVDITAADFLLAIGRGVGDEADIEQFEELAGKMGAMLSVSRPLVDAGWVSNARQVGQSGKTVKPKLYLAMGISGAVQHLAGIQQAETVIAVNTDPHAPIFGVANYGAVADMFEVAQELADRFD